MASSLTKTISFQAATSRKLDDDTTVDDIFISKKKSAKMDAKEKAKMQARAVEGNWLLCWEVRVS